MLTLSKKYTNILYIVFLIISIIYMLIRPDIVINSIKDTLSTFVLTVLPTLFPFILCSQMIIMLGGARIIGYPLVVITRLLGIEKDVAGAYAASLVGGYPSGAASLSLLKNSGHIKGNYLVSMLLCSNCGPMFAIGTVGTVLLDSYGAGIVILLAHIVGGVINAFLASKIFKAKNTILKEGKGVIGAKKELDIFRILDRSIINTSKIMIKIFAFMGIFKLVGDAIFENGREVVENISLMEVLFRGSLEIMDGCVSASKLSFYLGATTICAIVSFGGMSAVFQSISVTKEIPYSRLGFFFGKVTHAVISGILCFAFIRLVPSSVTVYTQLSSKVINMPIVLPRAIFWLMGGCLVYVILRSTVHKKQNGFR